jgi:hypothetical protein
MWPAVMKMLQIAILSCQELHIFRCEVQKICANSIHHKEIETFSSKQVFLLDLINLLSDLLYVPI